MKAFHVFLALCAVAATALPASWASADSGRLRLMNETIPFTEVLDAADGDDPFDAAVHIDFERSVETGTIKRQNTEANPRAIADFENARSSLMFGVDIGLYKDLMATFRMPLIVADDRQLKLPSSRSPDDVRLDLSDPTGTAATQTVFDVPFKSPTRAGLDYIGLGFAWGVINQARREHLPTLVLLVEGRVAVGKAMVPCQQVNGQAECGNPGINVSNDPGSSRGTNGFHFETRTSRRYRYAEPYGGIGILVQWPTKAKEYFRPGGDLDGYIHKMPAQSVDTQIGAMLIPWENRARFQRFGIDLQAHGTYISEGREYSPLYDALGTSSHPHLSTPLPEGDPTKGTINEELGFYGLTDVEAHFRYGFKVGIDMQAAEYVRLTFGSRLNWVTTHDITAADPCNPNVTDAARKGSCASGVINPHHRANIDLPGRRFLVDGMFSYDIHAGVTAQF